MFPAFTIQYGGRPLGEMFSTVAEQNQYVFEAVTIGSHKTFPSMEIGPPDDEKAGPLFPTFDLELPETTALDRAVQ